jgi:putative restriction endonuclease
MGTLAEKPVQLQMDSFKKLGVYSRNGRRAVHKPLLVLLLLADIQRGGNGELRFNDIESKLSSLIDQFSGPAGSSAKAHYPFWYLQSDHIWSLSDRQKLHPRTGKKKGGEPSISLMREVNPLGAMPTEVVAKLRDPMVLKAVARDVLESGFPPGLRANVLDAVGLDLKE